MDKGIRPGKLRFMIGLARSGKSTWANEWVRNPLRTDADGYSFPRVIACADDVRWAVTGERFNKYAESSVYTVKYYMIKSLLRRGHDVLVDETNTTYASIRRILEIDPFAQYTLINTPVEVCKERAVATDQADLLPVLDRLDSNLKILLKIGIDRVCDQIRKDITDRWPTNV